MRRRLRGKHTVSQPYAPPTALSTSLGAAPPVLRGAEKALAAEEATADGLLPLPWDARRHHIHWTHCRTHTPTDVQPHELTRQGLWEHLAQCYKEAYPKAESDNGSPLEFGVVCKDLHEDAAREADRSVHTRMRTGTLSSTRRADHTRKAREGRKRTSTTHET